MIKGFWNTLSSSARIGFVGGVILIFSASLVCAIWLLHTEYQVLFADLKPQDSAVMVAELDRLKIPYKIGDEGNAILVDKDIVHTTRFKLMGKDLPLHGAVGFELFNNSDFGMTEFAQKINYQRALQGEITRTILSLDEVKDVRVHLALAEEGLFKRQTNRAKAAINISLKPDQKLRQEQILGIQRLVASAVPGIAAQDVTIVDQQGVALTRPAGGSNEQDLSIGQLELKKDTENLLAKKVINVLEQSFGAGAGTASVDVTLNMDQVKVTTEDVIPAPSAAGQAPTGVIVRDREVNRDVPPLDGAAGNTRGSTSQRDLEYQVGRRVEQIIGQPGSIRRIHAVAVVHKVMSPEELEQVRTVVAATIGAAPERGDQVVVQSLAEPRPVVSSINRQETAAQNAGGGKANQARQTLGSNNSAWIVQTLLGLIALALIALVFGLVTRARAKMISTHPGLSEAQRQIALEQITRWMHAETNTRDADAAVNQRKEA